MHHKKSPCLNSPCQVLCKLVITHFGFSSELEKKPVDIKIDYIFTNMVKVGHVMFGYVSCFQSE